MIRTYVKQSSSLVMSGMDDTLYRVLHGTLTEAVTAFTGFQFHCSILTPFLSKSAPDGSGTHFYYLPLGIGALSHCCAMVLCQ